MTDAPVCAVTGTTGYLGGRLSHSLATRGWTIYRLSRARPDTADPYAVPFSLTADPPADLFREKRIDALVHCAYDFRQVRWADIHEVNVEGSIRLLRAARDAGVKEIIFISTISAFDGCTSLYGRAKLEIEREALRLGAAVVRPGLVHGQTPGAMMQALTKAVLSLPVVPVIGSGRQLQYLAHEADIATLVGQLIADGHAGIDRPIIAANEEPITLRGILAEIAARHGRRARLVPVPWRLVWAALKAAETAGRSPGFRSDSVVSLVNQDPHPDFTMTRKLGVPFRPFTGSASPA